MKKSNKILIVFIISMIVICIQSTMSGYLGIYGLIIGETEVVVVSSILIRQIDKAIKHEKKELGSN